MGNMIETTNCPECGEEIPRVLRTMVTHVLDHQIAAYRPTPLFKVLTLQTVVPLEISAAHIEEIVAFAARSGYDFTVDVTEICTEDLR